MSGDFWLGVGATVAFFAVLNASTAMLCLLFCRYKPPSAALGERTT